MAKDKKSRFVFEGSAETLISLGVKYLEQRIEADAKMIEMMTGISKDLDRLGAIPDLLVEHMPVLTTTLAQMAVLPAEQAKLQQVKAELGRVEELLRKEKRELTEVSQTLNRKKHQASEAGPRNDKPAPRKEEPQRTSPRVESSPVATLGDVAASNRRPSRKERKALEQQLQGKKPDNTAETPPPAPTTVEGKSLEEMTMEELEKETAPAAAAPV